jgi:hypothetical protein
MGAVVVDVLALVVCVDNNVADGSLLVVVVVVVVAKRLPHISKL